MQCNGDLFGFGMKLRRIQFYLFNSFFFIKKIHEDKTFVYPNENLKKKSNKIHTDSIAQSKPAGH